MVTKTDVKLSLGIPSYTMSEYHRALTERALLSYSAEETIVVDDGTGGSFDADVMINLKKNKGFTYAVNQILRIARGEFIAVANNDTYLVKGDLHDLCVPGTVTVPVVHNQTFTTEFKGCFFVIPRNLLPITGLLDESMKQYWSDQEFNDRLHAMNIPILEVPSVEIFHDCGTTLTQMPPELLADDQTAYLTLLKPQK